MSTFDLNPVEERDWLGWPQAGWVRPQFDVPSAGVVQRVEFGARAYWRQDNAWTPPVAITEDEYETFRAFAAARVDTRTHKEGQA